MNTTEMFLIAMAIILAVPYLIWRLGRTDYWAPLVVVQIIVGIVLGPGVLGKLFPDYYATVFAPPVNRLIAELSRMPGVGQRTASTPLPSGLS